MITPRALVIEVIRGRIGDDIEFAATVASTNPEPAELRKLPCPFECDGTVTVSLDPTHPIGIRLESNCDDPAHQWGTIGLGLYAWFERGRP